MKSAIPATTGLGLTIFGFFTFTLCYFIIKLSFNHELWVDIVNQGNVSPVTLIIAFIMTGGSVIVMGLGIVVMMISDDKADLPTKNLNTSYLKNSFKKRERKPSFYYRLTWIFIAIELASGIILYITGMKIIRESFIDWYLVGVVFSSLFLILVFNYLGNKKEKEIQNNRS